MSLRNLSIDEAAGSNARGVSEPDAKTGTAVQRLMDQALLEEIRAEVATIERHPALDKVRAALSTISGNMSDVVSEERGDY